MIELNNQSNWTAGLFPAWSQQGEKQYTIVVKKVYEYNKEGKVVEASVTPELVMTDEYAGEPGESTVIWRIIPRMEPARRKTIHNRFKIGWIGSYRYR